MLRGSVSQLSACMASFLIALIVCERTVDQDEATRESVCKRESVLCNWVSVMSEGILQCELCREREKKERSQNKLESVAGLGSAIFPLLSPSR